MGERGDSRGRQILQANSRWRGCRSASDGDNSDPSYRAIYGKYAKLYQLNSARAQEQARFPASIEDSTIFLLTRVSSVCATHSHKTYIAIGLEFNARLSNCDVACQLCIHVQICLCTTCEFVFVPRAGLSFIPRDRVTRVKL